MDLGSQATDTPLDMRIGVPKEIKTQEFRVGMTPAGVAMLTLRGHTVLVEQGAGIGSSITDEAYLKAGAQIVATREEVWAADMVVKVKEPIAPEFALMRRTCCCSRTSTSPRRRSSRRRC